MSERLCFFCSQGLFRFSFSASIQTGTAAESRFLFSDKPALRNAAKRYDEAYDGAYFCDCACSKTHDGYAGAAEDEHGVRTSVVFAEQFETGVHGFAVIR